MSEITVLSVEKFDFTLLPEANGLVLSITAKNGGEPVNYLVTNEKIASLVGTLLLAGQEGSQVLSQDAVRNNRRESDRVAAGISPALLGLFLRDKELVLDFGFACSRFRLPDDLWRFLRKALKDEGGGVPELN